MLEGNPPDKLIAPICRSRFATQVLLAAGMLLLINLSVVRIARSTGPRQLLRTIDSRPDATMLASGNSLMEAAFDEKLFQTAWDSHSPPGRLRTLPSNISLGATATVEQLLLLRHALARNQAVDTVVYGFYDLMLTDGLPGGWADLVGHRAMSYYVEPELAASMYAPNSKLERMRIRLIGRVPMLVERFGIWATVEKFRRRLGEIGLARQTSNRFGRANDFAALEIREPARFEQICRQRADGRYPFTPSVQAMIDLTNAHHARFVIVEMPMRTEHRTAFYGTAAWRSYKQHLIGLANHNGALFIDASDWGGDESFIDHFHLGVSGATVFTTRLASTLKPLVLTLPDHAGRDGR